MPPRYPVRQLFPEQTSYEPIALEAVQNPLVQLGLNYWDSLRSGRRFPRRDELDVRKFARALANMALIRVLDSGADYEFRIVGDEVRRAYPTLFGGRLLSEVANDLPTAAYRWGLAYRRVVSTALPLAAHVHVGLDTPEVNFSYAEAVCLPLGNSEESVDHLITFTHHTLEIAI